MSEAEFIEAIDGLLAMGLIKLVQEGDEVRVALKDPQICARCEANAEYNEAGGYKELAEQCRQYCLNGHKDTAEDAAEGGRVDGS